jgi:hypothetical protein
LSSHLEAMIHEYLDWQGYLVRRNVKVGRLSHGSWEGELDLIGYHPTTRDLVHYEPSINAWSWAKREAQHKKKFGAARKYLFTEVFSWLPPRTHVRQIAVFVSHPKNREKIAGGVIVSIDELMAEIRAKVVAVGIMAKKAIPEQYTILRTLQLSHVGYYRAL